MAECVTLLFYRLEPGFDDGAGVASEEVSESDGLKTRHLF